MLTAAIAERFIRGEIEEIEEEVSAEVDEAEADVLRELREIAERVRRLETSVQRLRRA